MIIIVIFILYLNKFQENNQLKKELDKKNEKIDKLNNLITDKLLEIRLNNRLLEY